MLNIFLSNSYSKYPVLRKTIHLSVPYYVKDKFESEYQGSLARLENSVEEEYIAVMKQNCYRERSYRKYFAFLSIAGRIGETNRLLCAHFRRGNDGPCT